MRGDDMLEAEMGVWIYKGTNLEDFGYAQLMPLVSQKLLAGKRKMGPLLSTWWYRLPLHLSHTLLPQQKPNLTNLILRDYSTKALDVSLINQILLFYDRKTESCYSLSEDSYLFFC